MDDITQMFDNETGVRQGCTLSSYPLFIAIDFAMRRAMADPSFGIKWRQQRLADLDFADYISVLIPHASRHADDN